MNESTDYFFRVKASDRTEMRRVLRAINVLRLIEGELVPHREGDAWVEIGRLPDWQNPTQWLTEPVSGEAYWHYNLRTEIRVRRRIRELVASGDPDAIILDSAKGRWYARVVDDEDATPDIIKNQWL
jgi:hypothetical protein